MKERPILFNDAMVRAILDGQKTQTRRPVKPQPVLDGAGWYWDWAPQKRRGVAWADTYENPAVMRSECPYGLPGDRLWVRETWRSSVGTEKYPPRRIEGHGWPLWYRTDGAVRYTFASDGGESFMTPQSCWRPSIHMPRWASRIMLEIVDVRVERVQDIGGEECMAEGIGCLYSYTGEGVPCDAVRRFRELWDSIYAERGYPWSLNPWVWVVEFKRVEQ